MHPQTIRTWLLAKPRPIKLRLACGDEVKVMPVGQYTWAKLAESISALQPQLIEALDAEGNVIRATHGEADELSPDAPPPRFTSQTTTAPATLVDTATLQLVAKLLADAYKHSTEVAFERLASLFEAVNKRSESLERSLATSERMRLRMIEDAVSAEPEEETGGINGLVKAALSGFAEPTKVTNGKA